MREFRFALNSRILTGSRFESDASLDDLQQIKLGGNVGTDVQSED